jgi:hypothetical protein
VIDGSGAAGFSWWWVRNRKSDADSKKVQRGRRRMGGSVSVSAKSDLSGFGTGLISRLDRVLITRSGPTILHTTVLPMPSNPYYYPIKKRAVRLDELWSALQLIVQLLTNASASQHVTRESIDARCPTRVNLHDPSSLSVSGTTMYGGWWTYIQVVHSS